MRIIYVLLPLAFLLFVPAKGQPTLLTVAEKSNYESTSTYNDVISFIEVLEQSSPYIRVETMARSTEGRDIPLLIIGNPLPQCPADLENDNRIVVYLQGNIHAGEVEGKEATLMLARDILANDVSNILKDVVVLICPILNADGNEKISTKNRTRQNGPKNGVGVRYNGQNLDLNRDAMKLETPEITGVVTHVLNTWDPAISIDCHTTNGSYHEEPITFTWMMNPSGDRNLINYMRDKLMPQVSERLNETYHVENIFYGEFVDRTNPEKGWVYSATKPRYLVNYIGLRNRLSILNENYVYADFETRVNGNYFLLRSLLEYASIHKKEIIELLADADARVMKRGLDPAITDSFAIEYKRKPTPEKITIKAFEADKYVDESGRTRYKKSDRKKTVTTSYFADYFPTKNIKFPYAYILSVSDPTILNLITTHGITVERLVEKTTLVVEKFDITKLTGAERLNQGHYTNTIEGDFVTENIEFPAGAYVVRTAQPLGNLAAYLLEPLADDGLLKWNFFDRYLVPQWGRRYYPYPVYRVMGKTELKTD